MYQLLVLENMKCLTSNLRHFCKHRIAISGARLNYLEAMSRAVSLQSSAVATGLSFPYWLSQTCCSIS